MIGTCASCRLCGEYNHPVAIGRGILNGNVLVVYDEPLANDGSGNADEFYRKNMFEAAGAAAVEAALWRHGNPFPTSSIGDVFETSAHRCEVPDKDVDAAVDNCTSYTRWLLSFNFRVIASQRRGLGQFAKELVKEPDWSIHSTALGIIIVIPDGDINPAELEANIKRGLQ